MSADHVYGYASKGYERLENFAETLDYAPPGERDKALRDYLGALYAVAASRTRVEEEQARKRAENKAAMEALEAAAAAADLRIVKPLHTKPGRSEAA